MKGKWADPSLPSLTNKKVRTYEYDCKRSCPSSPGRKVKVGGARKIKKSVQSCLVFLHIVNFSK